MMEDIIDVSQDIKFIRYGYLRWHPNFRPSLYDSSKDNTYVIVYDDVWKMVQPLMASTELVAQDAMAVYSTDPIMQDEYEFLLPRLRRSKAIQPSAPGVFEFTQRRYEKSGIQFRHNGEHLNVGWMISHISLKKKTGSYVRIDHHPCLSRFRYGIREERVYCNPAGEIHNKGTKIPAVKRWHIYLYNAGMTKLSNNSFKLKKTLINEFFYENGEKHRRNGPAEIVYSSLPKKLPRLSYYKEGKCIDHVVEKFGSIDDIDEFTWEMI